MSASSTGQPPYGFSWQGSGLVIQPEEAALRRKVFELFLEHRRKGTVADLLNREGHRTRNGKLWSDTQIDRLLTCPSAIGKYAIHKTATDESGRRMDRPESEWKAVSCPAVVSQRIWDEAKTILEQAVAGRPSNHPLTGLVLCHVCQRPMYLTSAANPNWDCSSCHLRIPDKHLSDIVEATIIAFLQRAAPWLATVLSKHWRRLPGRQRRSIMRILITRILVGDGQIEFDMAALL